jgi:hypothetical protein
LRAIPRRDQSIHDLEHEAEFLAREAVELHVVDLPLHWREPRERGMALGRDGQGHAATIVGVGLLVDHAKILQPADDRSDEGAGHMQVVGDRLDVHRALDRQMCDGNEHRIFDAGEPDDFGVAAADLLMPGEEAEQAVHQVPELAIRAVDRELGPRNGQREALRLVRRPGPR